MGHQVRRDRGTGSVCLHLLWSGRVSVSSCRVFLGFYPPAAVAITAFIFPDQQHCSSCKLVTANAITHEISGDWLRYGMGVVRTFEVYQCCEDR